MKQEIVPITNISYLTDEIIELSFQSEYLSKETKPGQFVNILVDNHFPLLRRPFSVFNVKQDILSIAFNIVGTGSTILSKKQSGDTLDVLGPCGNNFLQFTEGDFETAVIVAGGIGVAPFSMFTAAISKKKNIQTFLGGRTKDLILKNGLKNVKVSTDDGSEGFKGTVLDLIKEDFAKNNYGKIRFFTCGPSRMMKALAEFSKENMIECYASLETGMACGIGLCQGCNVELNDFGKKYALVCKEGTIFETQKVIFS